MRAYSIGEQKEQHDLEAEQPAQRPWAAPLRFQMYSLSIRMAKTTYQPLKWTTCSGWKRVLRHFKGELLAVVAVLYCQPPHATICVGVDTEFLGGRALTGGPRQAGGLYILPPRHRPNSSAGAVWSRRAKWPFLYPTAARPH